MKILEIIATKRTGQHAIISWIVKNITDMVLTLTTDKGNIKLEYINKKILYWNDGNNDQSFGLELFKKSGWGENLENLIINYEDVNSDYSFFSKGEIYRGPLSYDRFEDIDVKHGKRIVFIRDFYNCLASRYEQMNIGIFPHTIDEIFIDLWKNNAKYVIDNPNFSLKYEDWLSDKNKRNQILFDYFKINERYSPNNITGRKSSFNDNDYNKRYENVDLPEKTKDLIRKDNELHYLIGALGYQYKEV
jgi:hypothetical protein